MCYFPPVKPENAVERLKYLANKFPQYKIVTSAYLLIKKDEWITSLQNLLQQSGISFSIEIDPEQEWQIFFDIVVNTQNEQVVHTKDIYTTCHYGGSYYPEGHEQSTVPFTDVPFQSHELNKEIFNAMFGNPNHVDFGFDD